jgi:hypothetical protein
MADTAFEIDQTYAVIPIDKIQEHPQNPNKGDTDAIGESISANGWYGACIVQKSTGHILAGNHRYREAKSKGAKEIPVIYRDVDDETAIRILLADNEIARKGVYDPELLTTLLEGLESLDGTGWGHTLEEALGRIELEALGANATGPSPSTGGEAGDDDDVPDDKYTPQFAILITCSSEEDQRSTYEAMQELGYADRMRVVAV